MNCETYRKEREDLSHKAIISNKPILDAKSSMARFPSIFQAQVIIIGAESTVATTFIVITAQLFIRVEN
jgi:hypothetical protein